MPYNNKTKPQSRLELMRQTEQLELVKLAGEEKAMVKIFCRMCNVICLRLKTDMKKSVKDLFPVRETDGSTVIPLNSVDCDLKRLASGEIKNIKREKGRVIGPAFRVPPLTDSSCRH